MGKLRARKRASSLTVSFRPAKGADRTEVLVRGKNGTELADLLGGRAREATFGGVRWERRLEVTVRAYSDDGRAGPGRRIAVR